MVLYCRVPNYPSPGAARLTRRGALAGIGAVGAALAAGGTAVGALAGCTAKQTRSAADLIASDPLGPLYTETRTLIAAYDAAMVQAPELVPVIGALREEHRQHLVALASLIGLAAPAVSAGPDTTGSTTAPPTDPTPVGSGSAPPSPEPGTAPTTTTAPPATGAAADTRTTLSNAEKTARQHAAAACLAAPAGRVAVLASIAACLATHVMALR